MKITKVRATPVNIPLEVPFYWSVGTYPGTTKTIIEVETDEGIVGLGESQHQTSADLRESHFIVELGVEEPGEIIVRVEHCVVLSADAFAFEADIEGGNSQMMEEHGVVGA